MPSALHVTLATADALAQHSAEWWQHVLGAAYFGQTKPAFKVPDAVPFIHVEMQPLNENAGIFEIWHVNNADAGALTSGTFDAIRYRHNDALLFGCIALADDAAMQAVTAQAYDAIFRLLETLRYPHLLRVWNYMAGINAEQAGIERYRLFNAGRQDAFLAHQRNVTGSVPSACALGSHQGKLTIYFLAARAPYVAIENPRQVSAYNYPAEYGVRAPTFSRANVWNDTLFISGTASVVGHRSLHIGDVVAQTREALANIFAVLDATNQTRAMPFAPEQLWYKVYVRHANDLPLVKDTFERVLQKPALAIYLEADVCRFDLLVEIEATSGQCAYL